MSETELTEKRHSYSPAETSAVRAQTVHDIISAQASLIAKAPERTSLSDLEAVQAVTERCMRQCADVGILPNFELLAAGLGYSRRGVYDFLERHKDSPTAQYLDRIRTLWAAMRQSAADRGAVGETMSIFVLLNSSLGFTNQHTVEIAQPKTPLDDCNPEEARRRFLSAIPEYYDEMMNVDKPT